MVVVCCAPGCERKKDNVSTRGSTVLFHRFPMRKPDILAKWVKAMKIKNFRPTACSYLCNAHFKDSDYDIKPTIAGKHLKRTAVPSVFSGKRTRRPRRAHLKKQVESDTDSKGDAEQVEEEKTDEVEYLDDDAAKDNSKNTKSKLAGILENEKKEALQVLIVGEDGSITNSDYVLKKEVDLEKGEGKEDFEGVNDDDGDDNRKDEFVLVKTDGNGNDKNSVRSIRSKQLSHLWNENIKSNRQIAQLEEKLMLARKKARVTRMKCKKLENKLTELKTLLKLLVLKRGKGEKNVDQLFEEYAQSQTNMESEVVSHGNEDSNSSQCI